MPNPAEAIHLLSGLTGDPYICIERHNDRYRVEGSPAARIDHPWPRDPNASDVFAEWGWDGHTLHVRNDPWGFQPLFYVASPDRIAVATSIPRLLELGASTDLDDAALAVFLRLSHLLASDTPFKAIRALPRDARLTWRAGTLRISSGMIPPPIQRLSRAAVVDGYVTLFRQAVARRLPADGDRVIVPLSGGQDSRHLLFELVAQGCRPAGTVTVHHYPPQGNDDARVAPMVAAAVGVANEVLPLDWRRVRAERRKNVMTSFCADRHAQMLPLVDYLRDRADVIYDGLGGDILSGSRLEPSSSLLALLNAGRCEELARKLLTAYSDERALQAMLQPEARRRFAFDVATTRLAQELRRHLDWPHPWGSFRCANRTARSVALLPFGMLSRACRVMTPYLDRDLARFLTSLPTSSLADGQLHGEVIARAFPQQAHLRYEDRANTFGPAPGYYRRLSWDFLREALGHGVSPLVRRRFLASCMAKSALTGTRAWFETRRALYLMQLEECLEADLQVGLCRPA
jgi:asparagine synthase (glutamine-hydrolysing)